jgi:urea carboxylase
MNANVWQICVESGQRIDAGHRVLVLEAMKMEIAVASPGAGVVSDVRTAPGREVRPGQVLVVVEP